MLMNLDENESLNAVVAKFFYVYQSIPIESFRNSITYESLVDESFIGKVHSEEFPLAAKMSFVRKSDADNEFVGFYPVFFYDTQTIGLSGRYYNTQKGIYKNIGPAHDSDEFVKCLEMLNNDKEKDIYDYVTYSMRIDSGFLMTYQDAVSNFNEILKSYPKLPLMRCMDDAEHLGTKLEIAVDYIINPYVFSGIAVKMYSLSEESGSVKKHYFQLSPDMLSLSLFGGWEPINKVRVGKALDDIKKSIAKKRGNEDEILETIKTLTDEDRDK